MHGPLNDKFLKMYFSYELSEDGRREGFQRYVSIWQMRAGKKG